MTLLYLWGPRPVYDWILKTWGIDPFPFVFLDTDTVMSAVRCLRDGVDVFVTNPCDFLGRLFDYSPFWLLLAGLPVTSAWLVPTGLFVVLAFFLSLLLLPVGGTMREARLISLGAVSTPVVFAVERGNNDLVLFTLAAVAAALACRSKGLRLVGYGAALLAGFLKYYPMTLLSLAARERPPRFALVILLVAAACGLFALAMGPELTRALRLIPTGDWFGDMFGSSTVAGGLASLWGWPAGLRRFVHLLMVLGSVMTGAWLALGRPAQEAVGRLDERQQAFLLVGACLILGCFFTAQNIGYRSLHLLLALPSLLALGRLAPARRLWRWSGAATVWLLWAEGWRHAMREVDDTSLAIRFLGWGAREILWWWVVTVLIACAAIILGRSEIVRHVLPALARRMGAA
ncbi:MAG: hypothetical protein QM690_19840 [Sphingobium sp.]